jgi:hypothetical protein
MPCLPNASYFAGAALSVVGEGLFRQPVQPTGCSILLDLAIEANSLEFLEPGAKPGEVVRRKPSYGFFDLFNCHARYIAYSGEVRHGTYPIASTSRPQSKGVRPACMRVRAGSASALLK